MGRLDPSGFFRESSRSRKKLDIFLRPCPTDRVTPVGESLALTPNRPVAVLGRQALPDGEFEGDFMFESIGRGWKMAGASWAVLKKHPKLLLLPMISGLV